MSTPLFRNEATLALQNTLSSATADPRLRQPSGLLALLVISVFAFLAILFVQISLGVEASGVIRSAEGALPVISERGGILTFIASERTPMTLKTGELVARIKNLDLPTLRHGPNIAFSMAELGKREERITERIKEVHEQKSTWLNESNQTEEALISLVDHIKNLLNVYKDQVVRSSSDLRDKESYLKRGLIRKEQVENVQNLLTQYEAQVHESQFRLTDLNRQLSQLRINRVETTESYSREILALENTLADIKNKQQAEREIEIIDISMPRTGILMPRGFSPGQVVKAGDTLFDVAEEHNDYLFEVDVPAHQIGELQENSPVKIAITAYPYFEYGFLDGYVQFFSRLPNEPLTLSNNLPQNTSFRLVIKAEHTSFEKFRLGKTLIPGMSITAHIRKEKVAIWQLILAPLLHFKSRVAL